MPADPYLVALKADILAGGTTMASTITPEMSAVEVAAKYNDLAETSPAANVDRHYVTALELTAAIDGGEYVGLDQARRDFWSLMVLSTAADGQFPIRDPSVRQKIGQVFTSGLAPNTRSAMAALQTRPATPAEALFNDADVVVTTAHVRRARRTD